MSFLDLLCGGVKCRILVLDYAHPDEALSIERRVSRSAYQRYAVNGVLFASITEKIDDHHRYARTAAASSGS